MKLINVSDFGPKKWNDWVTKLPDENIYMYTEYLDATCEHWEILIDHKNNPIIPVPIYKHLGIRRALQPQFNRSFYLPEHVDIDELNDFLKSKFQAFELNFHTDKITEKKYQTLEIDNYKPKENARRMIKKALNNNYSVRSFSDYKKVVGLFEDTTLHKIDSLQKSDLKYLYRLCDSLKIKGKLMVKGIFEGGELIAGGIFMTNKKRIFYLKGAALEKGKKNGALFLLMDTVVQESKGEFTIFDFGGSSVEGVAQFYKRFGAQDQYCLKIKHDRLPIWFKWIRSIKRIIAN